MQVANFCTAVFSLTFFLTSFAKEILQNHKSQPATIHVDLRRTRHGRRDIDVDRDLEPTRRTQSSQAGFRLDRHRKCCRCHVNPTVPRTNDKNPHYNRKKHTQL